MSENCSTCKYYRPEIVTMYSECRKRAPKVYKERNPDARPGVRTVWPHTSETDWCGDYKEINQPKEK